MKTFKQYVQEAIPAPSGQTIAPTGTTGTNQQSSGLNGGGAKSWPGKGSPLEVGMTVGLKGPNGLPVPGQISQVDAAAKGVKVKNPTTGQDEWMNNDTLMPFMTNGQQPPITDQGIQQPSIQENDLQRLRELAGIKENCSAGATGAGSIAIANVPMGGMKKRQHTEEDLKKEYTRTGPPKTIIGDTKPAQASGELSATLAANGKKTASRKNAGMRK